MMVEFVGVHSLLHIMYVSLRFSDFLSPIKEDTSCLNFCKIYRDVIEFEDKMFRKVLRGE